MGLNCNVKTWPRKAEGLRVVTADDVASTVIGCLGYLESFPILPISFALHLSMRV